MKPTVADHAPEFDRLVARGLEKGTDAAGKACPDADLLAAWFDRSLAPAEASRIELHAASCGVCQQILAALARSEPAVTRAAPLPEADDALARPWHWHWRWLVPVATVLVVAVVGSRTLWAPAPASESAAVGADARLVEQKAAVPTPAAPGAPAEATPVGVNSAATAQQADARASRTADEPVRRPNSPPDTIVARADRQTAAAKDVGATPSNAEGPSAASRELAAAPPMPAAPAVARPAAVADATYVAREESKLAGAAQSMSKAEGGSVANRAAVAERTVATDRMAAPAPAPHVAGALPRAAVQPLGVSKAGSPSPLRVAASPGNLPGAPVLWRFGEGGLVERSDDAGQTWQRQSSGVDAAILAGAAPSQRVCWLVGVKGLLLRTTDGRTWKRLAAPTTSDIIGIVATSETSVRITTVDRQEFTTSDGGSTWQSVK